MAPITPPNSLPPSWAYEAIRLDEVGWKMPLPVEITMHVGSNQSHAYSTEAYGMAPSPMPVITTATGSMLRDAKRLDKGRMRPPCTTMPVSPITANTRPFCASVKPKPPASGDISVKRMKTACMMVKPKLYSMVTHSKGPMAGVRIDVNKLENEDFMVPLQSTLDALLRASLGKDSGRRVRAKRSDTIESALATKHGRR